MMIKFSAPMFYVDFYIDKLIELNERFESSSGIRIDSVFGALSRDAKEAMGWENYRDHKGIDKKGVRFLNYIDEMRPYIDKLKEHQITFQYCLNSTKTMTAEDLHAVRPKIFRLCDSLIRNGIHHLKVSNLLLFDFISSYYGDVFTYYLSTTKEYSSIRQYQTLLEAHPNITEVCLPSDLNKDFDFIRNFQKIGGVEMEIMVNEGCIYACPWRKDHTPHSSGTHTVQLRQKIRDGETDFTERMLYYYTNSCGNYRECHKASEYFLRRTIMPFDIWTYVTKYNVTKFKFAGRDMETGYLINSLEHYLEGIDNFDKIRNLPWDYFNNYHYSESKKPIFTIEQAMKYYPAISHFETMGSLCHSKCGFECNYCYEKSAKLEEAIHQFMERNSSI